MAKQTPTMQKKRRRSSTTPQTQLLDLPTPFLAQPADAHTPHSMHTHAQQPPYSATHPQTPYPTSPPPKPPSVLLFFSARAPRKRKRKKEHHQQTARPSAATWVGVTALYTPTHPHTHTPLHLPNQAFRPKPTRRSFLSKVTLPQRKKDSARAALTPARGVSGWNSSPPRFDQNRNVLIQNEPSLASCVHRRDLFALDAWFAQPPLSHTTKTSMCALLSTSPRPCAALGVPTILRGPNQTLLGIAAASPANQGARRKTGKSLACLHDAPIPPHAVPRARHQQGREHKPNRRLIHPLASILQATRSFLP